MNGDDISQRVSDRLLWNFNSAVTIRNIRLARVDETQETETFGYVKVLASVLIQWYKNGVKDQEWLLVIGWEGTWKEPGGLHTDSEYLKTTIILKSRISQLGDELAGRNVPKVFLTLAYA